MRLLPLAHYRMPQKNAKDLDGFQIRFGTTCSGTDICVVAMQSIIDKVNNEFGVS